MGLDPITLALAKKYTNEQRLAYSEEEIKECYNLSASDAERDLDNPAYFFYLDEDPNKKPVIGDTYYFTVNGVKYSSICRDIKEFNPEYVSKYEDEVIGVFGNAELLMGDDFSKFTDEPYAIMWAYTRDANNSLYYNYLVFYGVFNMDTIDIENEYLEIIDLETLKIEHKTEVIQKIDPKFYDKLAWTDENTQLVTSNVILTDDKWEDYLSDPLNYKYGDKLLISSIFNTLNYGDKYIIVYDGVTYNLVVELFAELIPFIGNLSLLNDELEYIDCPFVVVQDNTGVVFVNTTKGEHILSVYKVVEIIHKVEDKYLPEYDMNEVNMMSSNFIKNKPCYNGCLDIKVKDAINNGNAIISNAHGTFVKVAEYVPFNNSLYNTIVSFQGHEVCVKYYFNASDSGDNWYVSDFEGNYIWGFSQEYINKNNDDILIVEPGIYVSTLLDYIKMPIIKKIPFELVTNDLPCGTESGEIITFEGYDEDNLYHRVNSGTVIDAYYRVHCKKFDFYTELIGSVITLNNGLKINVDINNIKVIKNANDSVYYFLVADVLLVSPLQQIYKPPFDNEESNSVDNVVFTGRNYWGVFATVGSERPISLKLPDKVKQLSSKYIPISTSETVGGVKANQATANDIQPVKVNQDGEMFIEPIAFDGQITFTLCEEHLEYDLSNYNINSSNDLIGANVIDKAIGRLRLKNELPETISDLPDCTLLLDDELGFRIMVEKIDSTKKPVVLINGSVFPIFVPFLNSYAGLADENKSILIYCFEDGVQLYYEQLNITYTLLKGWNHVGSDNFDDSYEFPPEPVLIDFNENYFISSNKYLEKYANNIYKTNLLSMFTEADTFEYTIEENDIFDVFDGVDLIGKNYKNGSLNASFGQVIFGSVFLKENNILSYDVEYLGMDLSELKEQFYEKEYTKVSIPYFKQIDTKFIPAALITDEEVDALIASII